jgi:hypothetical protein
MSLQAVIPLNSEASPRRSARAGGTRSKTKPSATITKSRSASRVKSATEARAKILTRPASAERLSPSSRSGQVRARVTTKATPETVRTSELLRDLLAKNPKLENFTVENILDSIGNTSFGASLMFFSIPEVIPIPIPAIAALVVLPTAAISTQMVAGKRQITLPKFLLKRSVPRKALVAAINTILPILEKAEKRMKRRWEWATDEKAQRLLGVFIFLLALSIAFPIPGFNMPQAIAVFVIGLGLVEKDGLVVAIGVLIGIAAVAVLGAVVFGLLSFI